MRLILVHLSAYSFAQLAFWPIQLPSHASTPCVQVIPPCLLGTKLASPFVPMQLSLILIREHVMGLAVDFSSKIIPPNAASLFAQITPTISLTGQQTLAWQLVLRCSLQTVLSENACRRVIKRMVCSPTRL